MPRIRTKLRSLMTRVLRRCGLDEQSAGRRRLNARRAAYIQPLESRQLLSVAIEMVVNPTGSPSAYVVDGSDVYASQADSFTIDFYVTHDGGKTWNVTGSDAGGGAMGARMVSKTEGWIAGGGANKLGRK